MISNFFRSTLASVFAAAIVIVAGSTAPAQASPVSANSAIIDISGIDLASADGQMRVNAEIARTARRLCYTNDNRNLAIALANRGCVAGTIAGTHLPTSSLADGALPTHSVSR